MQSAQINTIAGRPLKKIRMIPESGSAPRVKKTERRCFLRRDREPIWDQTTIDRLWVATQTEAMIETGPSPETSPEPSSGSEQRLKKEQTKK